VGRLGRELVDGLQPSIAGGGQPGDVRRRECPGTPGPGRVDERQTGQRLPRLAEIDLLDARRQRIDVERRVADEQRRIGHGQHRIQVGRRRHRLRGDLPQSGAQHVRQGHRRA